MGTPTIKTTTESKKPIVSVNNWQNAVDDIVELGTEVADNASDISTLQTDVTALEISEQTITTAGAGVVTAGVTALFLDNDTSTITATIADASLHQGFFQISTISEPAAGQDHTVTITSGAFNAAGNTIATFSDIGDSIFLYFNQSGIGNIIVNTGSVVLS